MMKTTLCNFKKKLGRRRKRERGKTYKQVDVKRRKKDGPCGKICCHYVKMNDGS